MAPHAALVSAAAAGKYGDLALQNNGLHSKIPRALHLVRQLNLSRHGTDLQDGVGRPVIQGHFLMPDSP